jgi:hypothetical protein
MPHYKVKVISFDPHWHALYLLLLTGEILISGERGVMVAMGHGLCVCVYLCVWKEHKK